MSNVVGTLIREKRKERKLTQAQLAELIGSDEYYISALETGKRNPGTLHEEENKIFLNMFVPYSVLLCK